MRLGFLLYITGWIIVILSYKSIVLYKILEMKEKLYDEIAEMFTKKNNKKEINIPGDNLIFNC